MSDSWQGPGWWQASDGRWYPPSAVPGYAPPAPVQQPQPYPAVAGAGLPVRPYNQRMARRVAKRAHLDEQGAAVCFAYNNLLTTVIIGAVEDVARLVPTIGDLLELAIGLLTFYFHRIVLVTDQHVYVYRDRPFHIPGKRLAVYPRHPGVVSLGSPNTGGFSRFIRRGQLNFEDGLVVYHGFFWIRRARYIAQEANVPRGFQG